MKFKPFEIIIGFLMVLVMIVTGPVLLIFVFAKSAYEILRDGLVSFAEKGKDLEEQ